MKNSLATIKPLLCNRNLKGFLAFDAFVTQFFSKTTRQDDFAGQVVYLFCLFSEKGVSKNTTLFQCMFLLFHNFSRSHTVPK